METSGNSISLSERLMEGKEVKCLECQKGIYIPANKEAKVNHYYRCSKFGSVVILEPYVEVT